MTKTPSFDIVVYGATGFSGGFVTQYLAERSKSVPGLRWAIAGRSRDKLEKAREETGAENAGIIVADASDQSSLDAMVASAGVILTTVGPYSVYGSPLVEACARLGADYVDLTGEPNWMRQMIDAHQATARKSRGTHPVCLRLSFDPVRARRIFCSEAGSETFWQADAARARPGGGVCRGARRGLDRNRHGHGEGHQRRPGVR